MKKVLYLLDLINFIIHVYYPRLLSMFFDLFSCSVLINIYLRNLSGVSISQINTAFDAAVANNANNDNSLLIRNFEDRRAIIIANMTYGMIDQNVHPGAFRTGGVRFEVEDDPVLNAVILGNWPSK